jgi:hypothetical protein
MLSGKSGQLTVDSGVALIAGMGALVLAAGLYEGHLVRERYAAWTARPDHGAPWRVKACRHGSDRTSPD